MVTHKSEKEAEKMNINNNSQSKPSEEPFGLFSLIKFILN
jgi:hypothetical protein